MSAYYRDDTDSSYHFCEAQTAYNNQQADWCWKDFLRQNDLADDMTFDALTKEQRDLYGEFENEYFEPVLFGVDMFTQKDEIVFHVWINYRDAPYYRMKYATTLKVIVMKRSRFQKMSYENLFKMLRLTGKE